MVFARLSSELPRRTPASDTPFSRHTSTSCHGRLRRCAGFRCRFLCTIVTLMPETASVSLRTLAFFFPLVACMYLFLLQRHFNPFRFLTTAPVLILPCEVSDLYFFSPSFSIFHHWASISSDEFPCHTILVRF